MDYELKKRFTFGVDSTNVGKPVIFLNDDHVAYIAGSSIIIHNLHTNEQQHFENDHNDDEKSRILGIDANSDVLVILEETTSAPYISYLSMRRITSVLNKYDQTSAKKFEIEMDCAILTQSSISSRQKVVPICVHKETSLVASLQCITEKKLSLRIWNEYNGLLLDIDDFGNSLDNNASFFCADENISISFHNTDNIICIQSSKCFWLYRIIQNKQNWSSRLVSFPIKEEDLIIHGSLQCHCWILNSEARMIFGTSKGSLLITEEGKIQSTINVGFSIASLLAFNCRFIVGGPDSLCRVYEENNGCSDEDVEYNCKSAFSIIDSSSFRKDIHLKSMTMSSSSEKISVFLSTVNEIYTLDLNQSFDFNGENFVQVGCGVGRIYSIATCAQKSVVLTAGCDSAIRCWDYAVGQLQFCKYYTERPLSVSLHESGLHAIVTFTDEVRCVHVLIDDLKTFWQKRMQRKLVLGSVFSNGCHRFAILQDVCIQIYDFFTGTLLHELKGHHKVIQLQWRHGDGEIISMDESGMLRRWDVQSGVVLQETSQFKANSKSCFTLVSRESLWMITGGNIHVLSQRDFKAKNTDCDVMEKQYLENWNPSHLTINDDSSYVMIRSDCRNEYSSPASLRICKQPFSGYIDFEQKFSIYCSHIHKDIIFCTSNNNLHVLQLKDMTKVSNTLITQISMGSGDTAIGLDHNLVSEIYIEERNSIVNDLTLALSELKAEHDYKVNMIKLKNEDEIFHLEEKLKEQMFNQNDESELASNEKKRILKCFQEKMNSLLVNHQEQVTEIENYHSLKMQNVVQDHNNQREELKEQIDSATKQKLDLCIEKKKHLHKIKSSQMSILDERKSMTKTLKDDINDLRFELIERKDQVEDDIDTFIQDQKRQQEERLMTERQTTLKVAGENGILSKRTHALVQNIEDQKEAIKHMLFKEESDRDEIKLLEKKIANLLTLKKQRQKIFSSKEKTSLKFRKRKEELSKFSVLDEKLQELKLSLDNDETILTTRMEVKEKERLLAIYESEHEGIEKLLAFRNHEIREKNASLLKENEKYVALEGQMSSFRKDLCYYTELLNKPDLLLQQLRKRKNVGSKPVRKTDDSEVICASTTTSENIAALTAQSKALSCLLQEEQKKDRQEMQSLRVQNQILLEKIRETSEGNKKAKNRLSKVKT